jgi:hypothetical protein
LLQSGYDIRTVQDLLGHVDVATTMIYTHVLKLGGGAVLGLRPYDVDPAPPGSAPLESPPRIAGRWLRCRNQWLPFVMLYRRLSPPVRRPSGRTATRQ